MDIGDDTLTVCIIEDFGPLREQIVLLLEDAGARVVAAVGTASEGEVAIRELHPDVAVVDNRLPDGQGIDLLRKLSSLSPQVRLLLHSGVLHDADRRAALDAGAAAVVAKTIRGDTLLQALRP